MELIELKNMWQQYDKKLSENTRLNKEILKQMLISKPEKRLNWMRIREGFYLILPLIFIPIAIIKGIQYRTSIGFFSGVFLFGLYSVLIYFWSVNYYLLINKIDFKNPITLLKKHVNMLEKYEIKRSKFAYILMPFAIIGMFLMCNIPILSKDTLIPVSLMVLIMVISFYYRFKYSIFERFKKINNELIELEKLEKE